MIQLFVIHNNEQDRLSYLLPKLEDLVRSLNQAGRTASLELVGSEIDLVQQNRYRHTFLNKLRRGIDASAMSFFYFLDKPEHASRMKDFLRSCRDSFKYFFCYPRSVRIEQEVLLKHVYCWRKSSKARVPAIILESDAIVHPFTNQGLLALLDYLEGRSREDERYYVDLAGGCDRRAIFNSWCFESKHGCRDVALQTTPEICVHLLPRLTTNTVGGYLISSTLAGDLFNSVLKRRPMLAPDWAINIFTAASKRIRFALCMHTTPTLFTQGSTSGNYVSAHETGAVK